MNVVSDMRFLLITLCSALLAGCASQSEPEPQTQNVNEYKLYFVNTKWNDTMVIRVLYDSSHYTIGYLLGGDTFAVDSSSRIDSAYQYIRNKSLLAFAEKFCDTANEKPVHPAPVQREEIDLLVCNEAFLDDQYQWLMIDSGYSVAPIYFQEINLDNNRKKELVVEIIRDNYWEHLYMIYQQKEKSYELAGTISAINRNFWPAPLERIEKSDYWAVPSFGWGTGYSAIYHTYYKLIGGIPIQMSEQITVSNYHWLYSLLSGDYTVDSYIDSEVSFPDPNTLSITYSYSLIFFEDTNQIRVIDEAHYRTAYYLSPSKNRFETKDIYLREGDVDYEEEIELTPVFAGELERLQKHGTPLQKRLLKGYRKSDWLIPNNIAGNTAKSDTD
ncbi:MAG: hypothetical protein ACK5Z2_13205 [Bacteroidota bacterium]|jgi:hypothetical protein